MTAVTLANYEFHSSGVREFEVWGTAGAAEREDGWRRLARCAAEPGRDAQTFEVPRATWSKFVQLRFTSHYGSFHFCTVSLLRVHGKDATQTLKEEMEAIDAEVTEVEEILRDAEEAAAAEAQAAAKAAEAQAAATAAEALSLIHI